MIAWHSSTFIAIGFSHYTYLPASAPIMESGRQYDVGNVDIVVIGYLVHILVVPKICKL